MAYDAVALRKMNVDPAKWRWFNQNYDPYRRTDPVPEIRAEEVETASITSTGMRQTHYFLLFIYASIFLFVEIGAGSLLRGISLVGVVLLAVSGACVSRNGAARIFGYLFFGTFAIASLMLLQGEYQALGIMLLVSLVASWVIMLLRAKSVKYKRHVVEGAYGLSGFELWDDPSHRVWGNAGGVASAVDKFGEEAVAAGVEGEERTLLLLDMLLMIPGTTVYHGLKFPGSQDADVDHAVAHGSTVYLIDSKMYRWGAYEWKEGAGGDLIARSDGYGRPRKNHMAAAAQGYREVLGHNVNVVPIVLVHGKNVKITGNPWTRSGVGMFTAQDALSVIGNNIGESIHMWRDNELVRRLLVKNMKP